MAKVKFGAIVTDMRNKVGSQVFSRNRSGAYVRGFQTSVPSSTASQVIVRNRLATLASNWSLLTQSQRDAWNAAVSAFLHTDIFGSVFRPSGFDLFCKLNANLLQIGGSQIDVPPLPGSTPAVSSLSITAESVTPSVFVSIGETDISSGYKVVIMCTACISPGINYVKHLVREVVIITPSGAGTYDISAEYITKFSTITSTKRISVCAIVVNETTGQKSIPLWATCIVGASAGLDFNQALNTGIPLT